MIAILLNLFFELCLPVVDGGGVEAGEGVGGTAEHGFKGGPHKREFPSKEEFGKISRALGIEPFKWL